MRCRRQRATCSRDFRTWSANSSSERESSSKLDAASSDIVCLHPYEADEPIKAYAAYCRRQFLTKVGAPGIGQLVLPGVMVVFLPHRCHARLTTSALLGGLE